VRSLGARPVVSDALDPTRSPQAVASAEAEVIVHELTALSGKMSIRDARRVLAFGRSSTSKTPRPIASLTGTESPPGPEELPRYVAGDPAGAAAVAVNAWSDGLEGARSQPVASFSDLPERPASSLADIGSVIVGCGHDGREQVRENAVVRVLGVHGTDCNKDECGALYELFGSSRPFDCLRERERGMRKEVLTNLVADLPVVE
jgi:hypothetical protein